MSKVTQALLLAKVNSSPINGLVLYCDEDTQEALGQMSIDIETEIIKGRPYVLLNGLRI